MTDYKKLTEEYREHLDRILEFHNEKIRYDTYQVIYETILSILGKSLYECHRNTEKVDNSRQIDKKSNKYKEIDEYHIPKDLTEKLIKDINEVEIYLSVLRLALAYSKAKNDIIDYTNYVIKETGINYFHRFLESGKTDGYEAIFNGLENRANEKNSE